jgi:hypothetical protein
LTASNPAEIITTSWILRRECATITASIAKKTFKFCAVFAISANWLTNKTTFRRRILTGHFNQTKKIMGANARSKGQRGERAVIDLLQGLIDDVFEAHRLDIADRPDLQRNTLQCDRGGNDIAGLDWLAVEVKHQEKNFDRKWWEQCLQQTRKGQIPVLFYKQNRRAWTVRTFVQIYNGRHWQRVAADLDEITFCEWFSAKCAAVYVLRK